MRFVLRFNLNRAFIPIVLVLLVAGAGVTTQITNPASSYCIDKGGTLKILHTDGGQYGVCTLPNGVTCEEWAYYRGDCPP